MATRAETEKQAKDAYGHLGVRFEENRGQVDERVRFLSRHGGASLFLTNDEASFVLRTPRPGGRASAERPDRDEGSPDAFARRGPGPEKRERPLLHTVSMKFEGANPAAEVVGERELEGKVNYFRGDDSSKWLTNVRTYSSVRYRGIYEGVDLVYYGNERGEMEYDFVVAAGTDPGQISLRIEGAKGLKVDAAGDLVISTPAGPMRQHKPEVYQEVEGARRAVESGYVLEPGGRVRFKLGEYDRSAPLVIDPVMSYWLIGETDYDEAYGVAADSSGNFYVTGYSTIGSSPGGSDTIDAFVAKLTPGGAFSYFTYLGSFDTETFHERASGYGIAADPAGNAYLAGLGIDPEFESLETETPYVGIVIMVKATPVIRGRVVTPGADGPVGVPSVTVNLTGAQTTSKLTDAQGYYAFTGLAQGEDYTVTPSKTNLSFIPPSRTYTNLFADVPNANFTTPSLLVNNAAVTEGNAGELNATFTVTLKPASTQPVTVKYQTIDGPINPAASGADYTPLPLTQLTFAPGETTKVVFVKVKGDTLDEAAETFRLLLSAPTGALIFKAEGVCVITDDDPAPSLKVNSVSVTEGDADVTATFTVTLSAASGRTVKVKYQTVNGTATAPADYTAPAPATLTFAPGETTKTVAVTIKGDALDEPAETFKLLLSSPTNATVATAAGTCTITDDD